MATEALPGLSEPRPDKSFRFSIRGDEVQYNVRAENFEKLEANVRRKLKIPASSKIKIFHQLLVVVDEEDFQNLKAKYLEIEIEDDDKKDDVSTGHPHFNTPDDDKKDDVCTGHPHFNAPGSKIGNTGDYNRGIAANEINIEPEINCFGRPKIKKKSNSDEDSSQDPQKCIIL